MKQLCECHISKKKERAITAISIMRAINMVRRQEIKNQYA
jgi:hypothetical protein